MNKQEKQLMVERLKENVHPWFCLPYEFRKCLVTNWEHVLVRHKNDWQKPWFPYRKLDDGCVVRLSPDFQLPAPEIEAPAGYRIVSMEDQKRCKFPLDCDIKYTVCGRHGWIPPLYRNWRNDETDGLSRHYAIPSNYTFAEDSVKERWFFNTDTMSVENGPTEDLEKIDRMCSQRCTRIEITAAQKLYLETKPETVDGFEWVLKVPESGETIMSPDQFTGSPKHIRTWPHEFGCQIDYLNRIRWVKVPVKPSSKFVEYPIYIDEGEYRCNVKHHNNSGRAGLHELPSIVGFTGDILFRYSDGTEQWRYTLTDRSRDGTPATPIAATFYVKGETK
jgi:hypothetical protein